MDEQLVVDDRDQFDEAAYLRLYPDIARAIAEGRERSAWHHFDRHGRAVTHYCPKHLSPLFSEHLATRLWEHRGHRYTTSHYRSEPLT